MSTTVVGLLALGPKRFDGALLDSSFAFALRRAEPRPVPADEAALVAAARQGDQRAFDQLYRRHAPQVFARLTRLIGPCAEREDVMQQVFLELYGALDGYRAEAPFAAFLQGITVRVGYDHLRRRARTRIRLREEDVAELVAPGGSPETQARERQELLLAFQQLDALKPKKRVAFVLHVVEGLSLEEMARLLATDARTLGQRVAYARRELLAMSERAALRALERSRLKWSRPALIPYSQWQSASRRSKRASTT